MVGPTGVGKTEIARRLAKIANAPFIKVEATKFTEIGYVGRDVEQIIRDLMEIAIHMKKTSMREMVKEQASDLAREAVVTSLVGQSATPETRQRFHAMLEKGELDEKEVEIEVQDNQPSSSFPSFDVPGMPGAQMGMINLSDMLGKAFTGTKTKTVKVKVKKALKILASEAQDKLLDTEMINAKALELVQQRGIVFIDEIDKICTRSNHRGAEVSREGVQRDLLPLIEGTTVSTKYGSVKTDHILFITSGAFHVSKPSDLLPELQGRLPIRVELQPLNQDDFVRIMTEPEGNLIHQSVALMATEEVKLVFSNDAIEAIAQLADHTNATVENIGARRLHTILEKLLEDISFEAPDRQGEEIFIDASFVKHKVEELTKQQDLSKFIL
jgi:ATP-dependent HslUV protease ATP-binding subunit HslU